MLLPDAQLKDLLLHSGAITDWSLLNYKGTSDSRISLQEANRKDQFRMKIGSSYCKLPKLSFRIFIKITIPDHIFGIVQKRLARKHKIIPFAQDQDGLKLACKSNDISIRDDVKKLNQDFALSCYGKGY